LLGPLLVAVMVKVTLSLTLGVVLFTDLITARSALGNPSTVADEVLSSGCGSKVLLETTATLVITPVSRTLATRVKTAEELCIKVPMVHTPVFEL